MLAIEFQKQEQMNFVATAYADELKNDLMKNFGLTRDQLYGNAKEVSCFDLPKQVDGEYWTPREIMQEYGQWCRKIEPDHWLRRLFEVIDRAQLDNVIVTDIRQMNEVQAVLNRGGYHIRLNRDGRDSINNSNHETETALDEENYRIDFHIDNSGTLDDLRRAAKGTVKALMKIDMYK
jgi:hypothetical protein